MFVSRISINGVFASDTWQYIPAGWLAIPISRPATEHVMWQADLGLPDGGTGALACLPRPFLGHPTVPLFWSQLFSRGLPPTLPGRQSDRPDPRHSGAELLPRPVGRPSQEPLVECKGFPYQMDEFPLGRIAAHLEPLDSGGRLALLRSSPPKPLAIVIPTTEQTDSRASPSKPRGNRARWRGRRNLGAGTAGPSGPRLAVPDWMSTEPGRF
jgi:hypothetical protein